jgi:prophage regulatory protein
VAKKADVSARTDSSTEINDFIQAAKRSLPLDGFTRWDSMKLFIPLSRETIRKLEEKGRFPRRVHITPGTAGWPNSELHRWLGNPPGYRAPVSDAEPMGAPSNPADPAEARSRRLEKLHATDKAKKTKAKFSTETA